MHRPERTPYGTTDRNPTNAVESHARRYMGYSRLTRDAVVTNRLQRHYEQTVLFRSPLRRFIFQFDVQYATYVRTKWPLRLLKYTSVYHLSYTINTFTEKSIVCVFRFCYRNYQIFNFSKCRRTVRVRNTLPGRAACQR